MAPVYGVGAGLLAPFLAVTLAESRQALDQSIKPTLPSLSRRARCSLRQTPACCQSRRRLQHVTPLPKPSSLGSIRQGMPLRSTNKMPSSAARSESRGRPPFGFGGWGGSRDSRIRHSSSFIFRSLPDPPPMALPKSPVPLVCRTEQDLVDVYPLGLGEGPEDPLGHVLGFEELHIAKRVF